MIDQSVIKSQVQNVIKHYIFIFYVLFEILIEKCSFLVSWQFIAKLGMIDQLRLGDLPVD